LTDTRAISQFARTMREATIQHDSQINKDKLQKELNRGKPNNKSKFTSGLL